MFELFKCAVLSTNISNLTQLNRQCILEMLGAQAHTDSCTEPVGALKSRRERLRKNSPIGQLKLWKRRIVPRCFVFFVASDSSHNAIYYVEVDASGPP